MPNSFIPRLSWPGPHPELAALTVADFSPDAGTLAVRASKSGKPRHVVLAEETQRLFADATAGRASGNLIYTRPNGACRLSPIRFPARELGRHNKRGRSRIYPIRPTDCSSAAAQVSITSPNAAWRRLQFYAAR